MVRTAASKSAAVRSGVLVLAISSICARVILPVDSTDLIRRRRTRSSAPMSDPYAVFPAVPAGGALAVDRGREDLAREALREKKKYEEKAAVFAEEVAACNDLVAQYKQDIAAVEAKIQTARDKHRLLAQRHARARNHKQAQTTLRKADSLEALARFDRLENRIERMEAEADLVDPSSNAPLVEQFEALKGDDELDRELAALKQQRQGG